jgi:hypothetical protein
MALARAAAPGDGEDHRHIDRIDFLLEGDADRPTQGTLAQRLPEGALKPYPASASTQPKRRPAARARSISASAISGLVRWTLRFPGTPGRERRAGSQVQLSGKSASMVGSYNADQP